MKRILKVVLIGAITTIIATGCKKDKNIDHWPERTAKENAFKQQRQDMVNKICAYPYWIATDIVADAPVDLYGKGATRDVFSQRPEHQGDYYIEVKQAIEGGIPEGYPTYPVIKCKLHFGNKKRPDQKELKQDTFYFNNTTDGRIQLDWIRPYEKPLHTYDTSNYFVESVQDNELKLYDYDYYLLKTTVHVTFKGSNTKPF